MLILDEPTSSVDTETEKAIMEATLRLIANRTVFIIAHRHTTLRYCDLLLVLDEGRIVKDTADPQSVLQQFMLDSKGEWTQRQESLASNGAEV